MIVQTQQARIGPATPYPNDVLTASNDDTTFQKERTMVIASQARLRVALVLRVLLAASALLFGGWAGPGALAQEGSLAADIGDDGILTNCVDPAFPPMEYYKDQNADQPIGFDIDLTTEVANRLGVEAEFIPLEFTGLLPGLQSGRCDIVA